MAVKNLVDSGTGKYIPDADLRYSGGTTLFTLNGTVIEKASKTNRMLWDSATSGTITYPSWATNVINGDTGGGSNGNTTAVFANDDSTYPALTYGSLGANVGYVSFGCFHNGSNWISANASGNFRILPNANTIEFGVQTATTKGTSIPTFVKAFSIVSNGYVTIGTNGPEIAQKHFSGVTGAVNTDTIVPTGVAGIKILSVSINIHGANGDRILFPGGHTSSTDDFSIRMNSSDGVIISLKNTATNIANRDYLLLITYQK